MVTIPAPVVTQDDLNAWYEAKEAVKKYQAIERAIRSKIFGAYFPDPKEGTNTVPFNADYDLKAKHTIERKVDVPVLQAMTPELREKGYNLDALIRWKPELAATAYKQLTAEEKQFFDQVLTIKDGSPQIEFALNKQAKARQAAAQKAAEAATRDPSASGSQ